MSSSDNIKVFIRIRPLNKREALDDPKSIIYLDKNRPFSLLVDPKDFKTEPRTFNFDWIAGESSTQQEIFEVIGKPMTETYLQGYNCCIFAYGQTGAGKTYTMQGRGLEFGSKDEIHRGLQPRIIDQIFAMIAKDEEENPDVQYSVKCGYLEIYNEQIMDLFNPAQGTLNIREDIKEGVYIEDLTEIEIEDSATTINFIRQGAQNRHTGSTNMNQESSRSHSLFIMTIQRKTPTAIFTSKFNFVDLAGSERQKQTNTTGILLKEAGNINKSLSVLGLVINNLVEAAEGKARHIAYRDSKLTFILRDSLGGNSKTCLIANVSPAISSLQETISTLKFAQRAKQIKNKASINEDLSGDMDELKKELDRVKKELIYYKQLELEKIPPQMPPQPISIQAEEDDKSEVIEKNLQLLEQNKQLLVCEIEKKGQFCQKMKDIYSFYSLKEAQYSSICEVKESKIQRLKGSLSVDVKALDFDATLQAENTELRKENKLLIEVIKSTPLIMQATSSRDDRAARRSEAKDPAGAGASSSSSYKTSPQTKILLDKNLSYLQQLIQKLNNNLPSEKIQTERMEIESNIEQNVNLVTELTTQLSKQKENEAEQMIKLTEAEKKSEELLIELVQEKQKFAQELQEKLNYIQELEANRDNIPQEPIMTESGFTKEEKIKRLQEALENRSQATNDLENLVTKLSQQVMALSENVARAQQAEVQQFSEAGKRMTWEEIEKIKMNNVSLKSTIQELKRQKKIKAQRIQRQEALIRVLESDKRTGPKLDELIRPLKDMSEQLYSRFEEMNMDATLMFAENEKYKEETKQLSFEKEKLQEEKKSLLDTIEELTKAKEESDRNIKRLRDEKLAMMVDLIREAKSSIDHGDPQESKEHAEIPFFSSDNKENEVEPKATVEKKASCCQKSHLVGATDGMGPKSTVKSSQGKRTYEELESAKKSKKKTMIGGTNSAFKKFAPKGGQSASKMRGGSNEEPIILDDGDDVNIFEEPLIKKIKREH